MFIADTKLYGPETQLQARLNALKFVSTGQRKGSYTITNDTTLVYLHFLHKPGWCIQEYCSLTGNLKHSYDLPDSWEPAR